MRIGNLGLSLMILSLSWFAMACSGTESSNALSDIMEDASIDTDGPEPANEHQLSLVTNISIDVTEESTLTLRRGPTPLLTLKANAFSIGIVDAIDPDLNYDPSYLEPGQFGDFLYEAPKDLKWIQGTSFSDVIVADQTLRLTIHFGVDGKAELTVRVHENERFELEWKPQSLVGLPVMYRLAPRCSNEEGFYGLGEYFDQVEHRGKVRTLHFVPAELESGHNEAHVPIPLLLGTRGWGLFIKSLRPMAFALGTEEDDMFRATVGVREAGEKGIHFFLFAEDHPLDLTKHYYELTGYPGSISRTALGPWIWRDEVSGQAQVEADFMTIRELDLATTGYWIDRPYATDVNSFDFKPDTYPDPSQMMIAASNKGLDMALWHTPYLDPDGELSGVLYEEALSKGFFPPIQSPLLAKWGPPIDLSNPDAFEWWQSLLQKYQNLGIRGYKLDYAQEVVVGGFGSRFPWSFHDGTNELTMHRDYQRLYHKVYREMLPDNGGFLLVRSGTYGDQVHGTIIWPGDIDATMAQHGTEVQKDDGSTYISVGGLPAAIIAGSSLGLSGFPYFASDTGGYRNSPPSKETFIRWFQHTAFSPVMQVGTNTNDLPWAFGKDAVLDEEILSLYRIYARLHLRLFPYLWTYAQRISTTGHPIQRPLGFAYPELNKHPSDVYLLGDELIVAPIITEGATKRDVLLPPGLWVDFFNGQGHQGGRSITIESPLEKIPVLLRAGAILPTLRPTISSIRAGTGNLLIDAMEDDANPLWLLLAPGPDSSFTLYDGTLVTQQTTETSLTINRSKGSEFNGAWVVEVFGLVAPPSEVTVDGKRSNESPEFLSIQTLHWTWSNEKNGTLKIYLDDQSNTVEITR